MKKLLEKQVSVPPKGKASASGEFSLIKKLTGLDYERNRLVKEREEMQALKQNAEKRIDEASTRLEIIEKRFEALENIVKEGEASGALDKSWENTRC